MNPPHNHSLLQPGCLSRAVVAIVLALSVTALPVWAQGEPAYIGWSKVESARETREYKDKVRDGAALDVASREFLQQTALPQLALAENRATIERTRRRMREVLLTEIEDDKAFADVSRLVLDFMTSLARDDDATPEARINAVLLSGELRSKDGKPWPPAQPFLAAAAGDAKLPLAVRIAALAGLSRHVDAYKSDDQALAAVAKTAGPAVVAILAEPLTADGRAGQEWLAARALANLPTIMTSAPKNVAAVLIAILDDPTRAIDVRVRAAAALGATAHAKSEINVAKLVEVVRGLAVQALEVDLKATEQRRFDERYRGVAGGGGGQPGGIGPQQGGAGPQFGFTPVTDPLAMPEQACRRAAWRLVTLADAVASSDQKGGLVVLLGGAAGPAIQLATTLREGGTAIDQMPDEQAVAAALAALKPTAAAPAVAKPSAAEQPAAEQPAGVPAANPNASPFDNPFGQ